MPLGHFSHSLLHTGSRHIKFGGWGVGIQLGNGFLDTCCRPVNTDLDFPGLPFAFCPPPLGVGLVVGPGLTPTLLAYCLFSLLFFVWLPSTVYFMGCHFRTGRPFTFLLVGQGTVPQPVKSWHPTCSSWWGGSQSSLEMFSDCGVSCQVNRRSISLIHLRRPGESLQDFSCSGRNPLGNSGGQVRGGHGSLGYWVALPLGVTWRRSGPPGATLRPPISMVVSVSVCVL